MRKRRRRKSLLSVVNGATDLMIAMADQGQDPALLHTAIRDGLTAAERLRAFLWRHRSHRKRKFDYKVATALATLHWYRVLWLSDQVSNDELAFALFLFERLHGVNPAIIPDVLTFLFETDIDEPDADEDLVDLYAICAIMLSAVTTDGSNRVREQAAAFAYRAHAAAERLDQMDPAIRTALALALLTVFEDIGDGEVFQQAAAHARQALRDAPKEFPKRLLTVSLLGLALIRTARANNTDEPLAEALRVMRPAVYAASPGDPHIDQAAATLLRAMLAYYGKHRANPTIAELAPELHRLLELIPHDMPGRDTLALYMLAIEAMHLILIGDISGALELYPAVEDLLNTPASGPVERDRLRLLWTGVTQSQRIIQGNAIPDAELATYLEQVREATTTFNPLDRAGCFKVTSLLLVALYQTTNNSGLIDKGISLLNEALATFPANSDEHQLLSAEMGLLLLHRHRARGDRVDLERAVSLLGDRLRDLRAGSRELAMAQSCFGEALAAHYLRTGSEESYRSAMGLLGQYTENTESHLAGRLTNAFAAGRLAATADRWAEAVDALATGISLQSRLVWRGLYRPDQELNLVGFSGMVNEAAAAATRAGNPRRAIELLEQGRAILMHQELDIRSDSARLRNQFPELATRLDRVHDELDQTKDRHRRRELARSEDDLIAEIQSRPGFNQFLKPPSFSTLRPVNGQTVVVINPADFGSDAYIVTPTGVQTVPLPELSTKELGVQVAAFDQALATRINASNYTDQRAACEKIRDVLDWLWHSTTKPVLDALGHTKRPISGTSLPRIHWCPTSTLSFLPLHAAAARSGEAVLDRVISSYALSLRTLRFASLRDDPPPDLHSLLVVAIPDTPGLAPLPQAAREASTLSGLSHRTEVITGKHAVHREVNLALRRHAWAHFACHAAQDLHNPSRSQLFLRDHNAHPLTVLEVSRLRLEHAQFAFFSACETARGGLQLPNETIHLSGAMHLAGYQHVIATLWHINDIIATKVAIDTYRQLRTHNESILAPQRAANSLHEAVHAVRRRFPDDPTLWASHIHIGP